jgi:hypothetical protein
MPSAVPTSGAARGRVTRAVCALLGLGVVASLTAGCGGAGTPSGAPSVSLRTPEPGHIAAVGLRFRHVGSSPPSLRLAKGYRPPAHTALVAGVYPNPARHGEFLGLIAIVHFAGELTGGALRGQVRPAHLVRYLAQAPGSTAVLSSDSPFDKLSVVSGQINIVLNVDVPTSRQAVRLLYADGSLVDAYTEGDGRALFDQVRKDLRGQPEPGFARALRGASVAPPPPKPTSTTSPPPSSALKALLRVSVLRADLSVPVTTYTATAVDAHGGTVSYSWRMTPTADTGMCGTPRVPWTQPTNRASWSHSTDPPDSCVHRSTDHPVKAEVTIKVTSGRDDGITATCDLVGSETQVVDPPDSACTYSF